MDNLNFSVPFAFNNLGQVSTTSDSRIIWQTRVILVITTRYGERLMRQDFGSGLDYSLFESAADASDIIYKAVTIAFNKWLPSLKLIEVTPQYDTTTGFMDITIRYSLPSGVTDEVAINTAIFSRSGDLIQEITRG